MTELRLLTFRLPADVERIYKVIVKDRNIRSGLRTKEQAARVAWRIGLITSTKAIVGGCGMPRRRKSPTQKRS
jgi:hypothetical protein